MVSVGYLATGVSFDRKDWVKIIVRQVQWCRQDNFIL